MVFPIWELELGGGLLIAIVAITHTFVSHFAIGGGLLLVVTEHWARKRNDTALLGWLERHSKFFALLTLVFGAASGVGIWFTIGLVHPTATSSLIHIFVWGWAIEWVFFVVEIAAAILYYRTWRVVDSRTHLAIGWIYFVAAFMSLVVINGILTFMYTPGAWLEEGTLLSAFFNPTYVPSLVVRTLAAVAFAGLYIFITAWREQPALRTRLARIGAIWALPATVAGPLAAWIYFAVAGQNAWDTVQGSVPKAVGGLHAVIGSAVAYAVVLLVVWAVARTRPGIVSLPVGILLLALGFSSIGGAEFVRENLRKPFVIGSPEQGGYMYVNAVRLADLEAVQRGGLLASSHWVLPPTEGESAEAARGRNVFRVACRGCHTLAGYNAIRPLVDGKSVTTLLATIDTLHKRRGRMPPFPGDGGEKELLAIYLAGLDGEVGARPAAAPVDDPMARGQALLEEHCLSCHSLDSEDDDPPALLPRIEGWSAEQAYAALGRLPELNEEMIDFEGTDEERRILADSLARLAAGEASP